MGFFSCILTHLFFREATSLRNPVKTSTLQQDWPLSYKWSPCPIERGKKDIFLPERFILYDLLVSLLNIYIVEPFLLWMRSLNKDSRYLLTWMGGNCIFIFPNFWMKFTISFKYDWAKIKFKNTSVCACVCVCVAFSVSMNFVTNIHIFILCYMC